VINKKYPRWTEWQDVVEGLVEDSMAHVFISGNRLDGSSTKKHIPVNSTDRMLQNMPYIQVTLSGVERGHDDINSGQPAYIDSVTTPIGGNKAVKEPVEFLERITFTIEAFSQRYNECVEIIDILHRSIYPMDVISIDHNGVTQEVDCTLGDFQFLVAEGNREGMVEFFTSSMTLKLYVTTTTTIPTDDDSGVIEEVIFTSSETLGDEETDEIEKTVT